MLSKGQAPPLEAVHQDTSVREMTVKQEASRVRIVRRGEHKQQRRAGGCNKPLGCG